MSNDPWELVRMCGFCAWFAGPKLDSPVPSKEEMENLSTHINQARGQTLSPTGISILNFLNIKKEPGHCRRGFYVGSNRQCKFGDSPCPEWECQRGV